MKAAAYSLVLFLLVSLRLAAAETALPLLVSEDFEHGAAGWQPTDPAAWKIADGPQGKIYSQFRASKYNPPFRSPFNIALLKDVVVGDFVFEARLQSTAARENPHQDLCLFWGYQDPAHFYYVHLGRQADPHSNQIMIVDGAPRKMITRKPSAGTPWTKQWHRVKVVRRVADGTIEIYFDDMARPHLAAADKKFAWGQVGIGSFDDMGNWDDVKLSGVKVEKPKP